MSPKETILNKLCQKAATKQEVYRSHLEIFAQLKVVLQEIAEELNGHMCTIDKQVEVEFKDKGEFEAEIRFSGDVLIFHMHTNTFHFDKSHHIWNSSYVKQDEYRAYCGVINVYNFLRDSFRYNRVNDLGYLIARIFTNKEQHFFVEGKGKLSFLHNDFANDTINKEALESIVMESIRFAMDFELVTPPFHEVQVVSMNQIKEISQNMKVKTGKRLGFRFSNEK